MGRQGTILVVDDNKSILKALELLLEKYFARTVMISSPNRIPYSVYKILAFTCILPEQK